MPRYCRTTILVWMIPLFFASVLLAASTSAQTPAPSHLGPSCKVVPNITLGGRTVEQVVLDINSQWGDGNWKVVAEKSYSKSRLLPVVGLQPQPGTGLTSGELMHIYVDGSGYMDTVEEKVTVIVLAGIALFLAWRCWRK